METRVTNLEMDEKVLEYRVATLEKQYSELNITLSKIQEIVLRLDSKFPAGGLLCPLHQSRLDSFDKRVEQVETEIKKIDRKIVQWSAIAAVILFILTNVALPYVTSNFKVSASESEPQTHEHFLTNPTNGVPFLYKH